MFKRIMFLGVVISLFLSLAVKVMAADPVTIWFPPEWKAKADMAKQIADALSKESNLQVNPRIATSYPDIIEAFGKSDMTVLYGGSFLTAILKARNLGNSLVQNIDGKELYSGIMVYPKGDNPEAVLKDSPTEIAFALGASSGESSAKAATGGKAAIPTPAHGASCGAIKAGKAKAAFVKNWWWEANKQNYPELDVFVIPGISEIKHVDNVLTVSAKMPAEMAKTLTEAAKKAKDVFGAPQMADFDMKNLDFTLELMKRAGLDPMTYSW